MKKKSNTGSKVYRVFSVIVITLLAIGFAFPLYWIITGSFKTSMAINAPTPQWWPQEWVSANYQKLFSRQTAPLWEIGIPFTGKSFAGPVVPGSYPLASEHYFHGSGIHASYLLYCSYGRICAGKETFYRTFRCIYPDRMCHGTSETGYLNPIAS